MTAEERARALHASLFAHRSSAEKEIAALTTALASARRDALREAAEVARHDPIIFQWALAKEAMATAIREAIASNIEALAKEDK